MNSIVHRIAESDTTEPLSHQSKTASFRLQSTYHPAFLLQKGEKDDTGSHTALSVAPCHYLISGGLAWHGPDPSRKYVRLRFRFCAVPQPLPSLGRDFLSRVSKFLQS